VRAELLDERRDVVLAAGADDLAGVLELKRSRARPGLAADDDPVDLGQVERRAASV
jgi:hypothetical protein